ncbi:MAG: SRPBCC family protein [Bacteroidia bacterium]
MKIVKRILLVLVVLVALLVVIALFLPSSMSISRSITIKAAPENVYSLVGNLKSWNRWSVWNQMDPNWKVTWGGPEEGKGSWYSWVSENGRVGTGKITITKAVPVDTVITKMEFMGSEEPAWGCYYFKPAEGGVTLTMTMDAEFGFNLIGRWMGLFMKGEIEKNFDTGLENIRKICEDGIAGAARGEYMITETWQNEQSYISIRDTATMATIGPKFGTNYGRLMEAMAEAGVKSAGPPFSLFHGGDSIMDLEWCISTVTAVPSKGDIKSGKLAAGKILKADYYGPYEGSTPANIAVEKYAAEKKYTLTAPIREIYITDPTKEPNAARWLTYIVRDIK